MLSSKNIENCPNSRACVQRGLRISSGWRQPDKGMKRLCNVTSTIALGAAILLGAMPLGCRNSAPQYSTPQLKIMYNTEEEPAEKSAVAQVLQSQLAKAGIQVTLDPVTNSVFYDRVANGNFQAALGLWYLDYD